MSQDDKPREYWILTTPGGQFIEYDEPMSMDWAVCSKVQVIERAAYDKLAAELAECRQCHADTKDLLAGQVSGLKVLLAAAERERDRGWEAYKIAHDLALEHGQQLQAERERAEKLDKELHRKLITQLIEVTEDVPPEYLHGLGPVPSWRQMTKDLTKQRDRYRAALGSFKQECEALRGQLAALAAGNMDLANIRRTKADQIRAEREALEQNKIEPAE